MKLLTKDILERLPPLRSQEEKGLDALAVVKFFTPDSSWTWYASEFDGADTFFGYVVGLEPELGYFSLSELQSTRGKLGLADRAGQVVQPHAAPRTHGRARGQTGFSSLIPKPMTYMQDLERELHDRLESFAAGDLSAKDFIAFVKKTVLDSYHNGQNAGQRPAPTGNGQGSQSAKPRWQNNKRSAANAPANSRSYQS